MYFLCNNLPKILILPTGPSTAVSVTDVGSEGGAARLGRALVTLEVVDGLAGDRGADRRGLAVDGL